MASTGSYTGLELQTRDKVEMDNMPITGEGAAGEGAMEAQIHSSVIRRRTSSERGSFMN